MDENVGAFCLCVKQVHRMFVRSHASSLCGLSTLRYPFMEKEATSQVSSIISLEKIISNCQFFGKEQAIEQVWEEYFADPSQWWDNRVDKRNSKSPDFKHKVTKKALWLAGLSTLSWVKSRLAQGKLQCDVGYHADDSKDTAQ